MPRQPFYWRIDLVETDDVSSIAIGREGSGS